MASELQTIVGVDLQGAAEGGDMSVYEGLGYGGGPLVGNGIEPNEVAEPILAGEDVLVAQN